MPSFLSKVFGRKKDEKGSHPPPSLSDPSGRPSNGSLLGGKYENISPNISPTASQFALAANGNGPAQPGVFKSKSKLSNAHPKPSLPHQPSRLPDLPLLSLNISLSQGAGGGSGSVGATAPVASSSSISAAASRALGVVFEDSDPRASLADGIIGETRLTPLELLLLIKVCSQAITERGLETLGIMHPHWYSSSPETQRKLISLFINAINSPLPLSSPSSTTITPPAKLPIPTLGSPAPYSVESPGALSPTAAFQSEIEFTRSPHDVAAVLRWGIRHLALTDVGGEGRGKGPQLPLAAEEWYKSFFEDEAKASYPTRSFSEILVPLLSKREEANKAKDKSALGTTSNEGYVETLKALFEIMSSLAAHAEANGISGSRLSKMFGAWVLSGGEVGVRRRREREGAGRRLRAGRAKGAGGASSRQGGKSPHAAGKGFGHGLISSRLGKKDKTALAHEEVPLQADTGDEAEWEDEKVEDEEAYEYDEDWKKFYEKWERLGRIFEHLFLARIRDEAASQRMPTRLLELVHQYPYGASSSPSPLTDLPLLPRPRFSTRQHTALYILLETQLPPGTSKPSYHPLKLLDQAIRADIQIQVQTDDSNQVIVETGDVWKKIKNVAEKDGLEKVVTEDTLRFFAQIPGGGGVGVWSPVSSPTLSSVPLPHSPSGASHSASAGPVRRRSFSLSDTPSDAQTATAPSLAYAYAQGQTSRHARRASEILNSGIGIERPLSPTSLFAPRSPTVGSSGETGAGAGNITDWAQFTSSGFFGGEDEPSLQLGLSAAASGAGAGTSAGAGDATTTGEEGVTGRVSTTTAKTSKTTTTAASARTVTTTTATGTGTGGRISGARSPAPTTTTNALYSPSLTSGDHTHHTRDHQGQGQQGQSQVHGQGEDEPSLTSTSTKVTHIQLDEAFVDFWSDALLDPISGLTTGFLASATATATATSGGKKMKTQRGLPKTAWPIFVICKLKHSEEWSVVATTATVHRNPPVEYVVIEQRYVKPPSLASSLPGSTLHAHATTGAVRTGSATAAGAGATTGGGRQTPLSPLLPVPGTASAPASPSKTKVREKTLSASKSKRFSFFGGSVSKKDKDKYKEREEEEERKTSTSAASGKGVANAMKAVTATTASGGTGVPSVLPAKDSLATETVGISEMGEVLEEKEKADEKKVDALPSPPPETPAAVGVQESQIPNPMQATVPAPAPAPAAQSRTKAPSASVAVVNQAEDMPLAPPSQASQEPTKEKEEPLPEPDVAAARVQEKAEAVVPVAKSEEERKAEAVPKIVPAPVVAAVPVPSPVVSPEPTAAPAALSPPEPVQALESKAESEQVPTHRSVAQEEVKAESHEIVPVPAPEPASTQVEAAVVAPTRETAPAEPEVESAPTPTPTQQPEAESAPSPKVEDGAPEPTPEPSNVEIPAPAPAEVAVPPPVETVETETKEEVKEVESKPEPEPEPASVVPEAPVQSAQVEEVVEETPALALAPAAVAATSEEPENATVAENSAVEKPAGVVGKPELEPAPAVEESASVLPTSQEAQLEADAHETDIKPDAQEVEVEDVPPSNTVAGEVSVPPTVTELVKDDKSEVEPKVPPGLEGISKQANTAASFGDDIAASS